MRFEVKTKVKESAIRLKGNWVRALENRIPQRFGFHETSTGSGRITAMATD